MYKNVVIVFLVFFFTFFSTYATNIDNEDSESLAIQLNHLETAINDEIQKTNDLVYLIEKRSLGQRAASGKTYFNQIKQH